MKAAGQALPAGLRAKLPEPPERRTGDRVRRHSKPAGVVRYAQIPWTEAHERLRALKRWERRQERSPRRKNAAVGHVAIEVYEAMCRLAASGRGRLDTWSYEGLARLIRRSRSAVAAAIARLARFGWLRWIRQFVETGERGARGPQVEQAPNAYQLIAPRAELVKLGIRLRSSPIPDEVAWAAEQSRREQGRFSRQESGLEAALDRLGAVVAEAERGSSSGSHS